MRSASARASLPAARGTAAALAVLGTLALGVATADAHTEVSSTSPRAGGTASTSVQTVKVTFTGQVKSGTIVVTRGGTTVSRGRGGLDQTNVKRIKVGLRSGLKAGRYTARWTAVAADGHHQSGSFTFRLKKR
ncbi:copper resistance CopC family protein [Patulibacter minatonensis]|uniref:copper resistance CopC family protein n=1 Tax=Patulibacter minatonensis TaxID=298163 RepID=UPI0004BCFA6F|nr:copper resistance CopC family protein [Patulibacter minatonensis]